MNAFLQPAATATRVAQHTAAQHNHAILQRTEAELARLQGADPAAIEARLRQLDREWDIERLLQLNAGLVSGLGLALSAWVDRRFAVLPVAVFAFFAQHAWQGWCPPIPLFRRLGVRTRREIERERQAIKAMRGDFADLPRREQTPAAQRVQAVLAALAR